MLFIVFVQPVSLISLVFVGIVLEWIRRMFAPAIRDIKRLESIGSCLQSLLIFLAQFECIIGRSPIYSHLSATIQGVILIRSYGAQAMCVEEFAHYLDEHTRAFSVMVAMNRWAATRIELVVAIFISLLTFSMLFVHRSELMFRLFTAPFILMNYQIYRPPIWVLFWPIHLH